MTMEFEQDLRYTSDELLRMLERLRELETRKRKIKPGTERFRKLAEEVQTLAGKVFAETAEQQRLAVEAVELTDANVVDPAPIDETPAVRELHIILNEWRDAERRLADAEPDSEAAADAHADTERLRQEYRRAAQQAWNHEAGR